MSKFITLKVADIRRETDDCVSVAFEIPEAHQNDFRFTQGQHLTLRAEIAGEDIRRSYSICTSPHDNELRVAIKKVEDGVFSTFANERLQPGDTLDVMPPMGHFYTRLDPQNKKHYVAFAAGSGITPVMSIMKTVLQDEPQSQFTLFYGNKNTGSIIFREEIEALKSRYLRRLSVFHLLSRESQESPLLNGRMSKDKCRNLLTMLPGIATADEFFLCGPEEMIHDVQSTLLDNGIAQDHIHLELFTTPSQGKIRPARPPFRQTAVDKDLLCDVTVKLDGLTFHFPLKAGGDSILDAAKKQGADVPFSCKGGVCCTCKARLIEGKVDMEINYGLEPEEIEAGYILTCQSHPRTVTVVVDYDAH